MKTEVFESDPFTPKKGRLIATLDTEYRFQKGDEVYFDDEPGRLKVRVIDVRIHVKGNGEVHRDILALKL
ncbi:MAG: hypothetical protein EPO22_08850 [Dehalococcoidia bacterium]|nr:MAG: hypothetical protein EPO22_08850 [Dehalococcoidia bacterium]